MEKLQIFRLEDEPLEFNKLVIGDVSAGTALQLKNLAIEAGYTSLKQFIGVLLELVVDDVEIIDIPSCGCDCEFDDDCDGGHDCCNDDVNPFSPSFRDSVCEEGCIIVGPHDDCMVLEDGKPVWGKSVLEQARDDFLDATDGCDGCQGPDEAEFNAETPDWSLDKRSMVDILSDEQDDTYPCDLQDLPTPIPGSMIEKRLNKLNKHECPLAARYIRHDGDPQIICHLFVCDRDCNGTPDDVDSCPSYKKRMGL